MKELWDLKDLMIHDVQPISDEYTTDGGTHFATMLTITSSKGRGARGEGLGCRVGDLKMLYKD